MNPLVTIGLKVIGGIFKMLPFIGAYIAGRKSIEGKQMKDNIKMEKRADEIEDTNKRLSDADLLDLLRERDSRDKR